ncbi:hypothetical protein GCM10022276_13470 [Sphingomonas limnosediminicola]|uniref:Uncharacterized protein n=1 Tax=Sphingomonas limnosediminicola TaxID=940133 RepID=A0ABP7L672_9SPHN
MHGVREYSEGLPVELRRHEGRLVLRAFSECGNRYTDVDLLDVIEWCKNGPGSAVAPVAALVARNSGGDN